MTARLLRWYRAHARALPWRAARGERPDPHHVWLSEIMLQQTTVATVRKRFAAFVARWPDVHALAAAPIEEVLDAWAGLGYYARARNLHKCAQVVAHELNGAFPRAPEELAKLPGIGPYTAGAIAAIAFDHPAVAMDTNAERVMTRAFAVQEPLPAVKPRLRALAEKLLPQEAPGDFAQALMELGALVCTARGPRCDACPWRADCRARRRGIAEELPRKAARGEKPSRTGRAFWIMRADGHVLLRRRPPRGMLGGMVEVPSAGWDGQDAPFDARAPFGLVFTPVVGEVRHVFTHFALRMELFRAAEILTPDKAARLNLPEGFFWQPLAELKTARLPTLSRKVARMFMGNETA